MERKQYVVIGEAPESDSEEEVNISVGVSVLQNKQLSNSNIPQGIIVAGEAPESDEECQEDIASAGSISSSATVSSIASLTSSLKRNKTSDKSKKQDVKYNTLLHKKLRERNISLYKNVNELIHETTLTAARDLNTTNQQLLRSQVQLQEAASSLHLLHTQLEHLNSKLTAITSAKFLPRINILPA